MHSRSLLNGGPKNILWRKNRLVPPNTLMHGKGFSFYLKREKKQGHWEVRSEWMMTTLYG